MGVPNSFTAGTTISSSEVNANFTNIENLLGYAQNTSLSENAQATETAITSLTTNVTVPSGGRYVRITVGFGAINSTNTDSYVRVIIKQNGTNKRTEDKHITLSGVTLHFSVIAVFAVSAGSYTFSASALKGGGTGTIGLRGQPGYPAFILVEQI